MVHSAEVVGRVQAGQALNTWQVLPASRGYFIRGLLIGCVLLIAVIGAAAWLFLNEHEAFSIGRGTGDLFDFETWRTIDFVVLGIIFLALAYWVYSSCRDLTTQHKQFVVLMPEGVVMTKGEKDPEVIDFSIASNVQVKRNRDDIILVFENQTTGKRESISMDGRFGNARNLAETITNGYQQFQAMRAGQSAPPLQGQPPQWGPPPQQGGQPQWGQPPHGNQPQH